MRVSRWSWCKALGMALAGHIAVCALAMWQWPVAVPIKPQASAPMVVHLAPLAAAKRPANDAMVAAAQPTQPIVKPEVSEPQPPLPEVAKPKAIAPVPKAQVKKPEQAEPKPVEIAKSQPDNKETHKPTQMSQTAQQQVVKLDAKAQADQASAEVAGHQQALQMQQELNWKAELIAHLAKKKRYPRLARKKRQQGTVLVRFSIAPNGSARDIEVVQASSYPLLNKEATRVIARAQPLPLPPAGFADSKVVVPVRFYLL